MARFLDIGLSFSCNGCRRGAIPAREESGPVHDEM